MINLEFQYFRGCPNHPIMEKNIAKAIEGLEDYVVLKHVIVENEEIAKECGFRGSPTLLIDGKDFENVPIPALPTMACRFYIKGVPKAEDIRKIIIEKINESK
jgi:protein-disulfide isomerase